MDLLSAPTGAAAGTGHCGMPERERAAGADSPLLYFQLKSEQKGQWNPTRRERVEQEGPLLWSVSCSLLLPCP